MQPFSTLTFHVTAFDPDGWGKACQTNSNLIMGALSDVFMAFSLNAQSLFKRHNSLGAIMDERSRQRSQIACIIMKSGFYND